jgi:hypothetical protein
MKNFPFFSLIHSFSNWVWGILEEKTIRILMWTIGVVRSLSFAVFDWIGNFLGMCGWGVIMSGISDWFWKYRCTLLYSKSQKISFETEKPTKPKTTPSRQLSKISNLSTVKNRITWNFRSTWKTLHRQTRENSQEKLFILQKK